VLFPVYLLVVGLSSWLRAATVASTQRDCYRAALSAARICGSEAVDEALRAALMWRRMSEEVEAARTRRRDPVAAAQSYLTGLDSAVLDAVRASGRTPPYAVDPTGAPPAALVQDVVDAAATVGSDTDSLTRLVSAAEADVTAPTA
jgi:hypothetical protein